MVTDLNRVADDIARGHDCSVCGASWAEVIDPDPPPGTPDGETEGGLMMDHAPDCSVLNVLIERLNATPDSVFAEGGAWS